MGKFITLDKNIIIVDVSDEFDSSTVDSLVDDIKIFYYSEEYSRKKYNSLIDLSSAKSKVFFDTDIRNKVVEVIKPIAKIDSKLAFVGFDTFQKSLMSLILYFAGAIHESKSFKNREEALTWLRE